MRNQPPTSKENTFKEIDKINCRLHIPHNSKSAYSEATGWKDFLLIEEDITPSTNEIKKENESYIQSTEGGIIIFSTDDSKVFITDLQGRPVYESILSKETHIAIPQGIYLIHISNEREIRKVIVF